jgi:hypothetical protein
MHRASQGLGSEQTRAALLLFFDSYFISMYLRTTRGGTTSLGTMYLFINQCVMSIYHEDKARRSEIIGIQD